MAINLKFGNDSLELNSVVVGVSTKSFRLTEAELLIGNLQKAKEKLGWEARPIRRRVNKNGI
ncbi:MAG TPA: hypothetical protein ENI76_05485 [Ignavibacteria bacterium]|nr:hypothetical protein [Ignavibacteria bacterium]